MTCSKCGGEIEVGTFHGCSLGTLRAPWLKTMMDEANRPILDELQKIRVALEKQNEPVESKLVPTNTKNARRETR
jgi:hypothetical protein